MESVLKLLINADQQLESVSVRGTDVFAMANARKLLKAAYDSLMKGVGGNAESVSDPGAASGELDGD